MQSTHRPGTIADYDDPGEPQPVINPYAVIALVAALLLVFPIAIIFGLIAFTYPRGRGLAWSALILGCLELGVVLTIAVIGGNAFDNASSALSTSSARPSAYATQFPTVIETTVPTTTPSVEPAPTTTARPTTTTTARPAAGSPCNELQRITTGPDGNAMVCSKGGGAPRPVWQSTGEPLQSGTHDEGESCDPSSTTRLGQNSEGKVVQCLNPEGQPGEGTDGEWTTEVNAN
ncbi:DUF4190 domain-containing protein [Nocardia sp. NPDC050712]|uniref:DUF4190 domain-containing protein n=1 Tax=Nocardia sp. NPDC050712 TaxID=3155518 RepID=UPI0033D0DDA2